MLATIVMVAALGACTNQPGNEQAGNTSGGSTATATTESKDYYTSLPLEEFMPHVMQYAADGIWKRQGYVIDAAGEHSLFPKNDEEWEAAESGARTLAEITNVLLLPGRRIDEPEWTKAVLDVRGLALKAADAAERKNQEDFFTAGSELDVACDTCHIKYDPKFIQAAKQ
jgi:hypothetical protein